MGTKDSKAKEYFADNERFADLCNYVLYGGRCVIKAENLEERDTTEVLTALGLSLNIHYAMPVKNMIYDALAYGKQVREVAKKHRREHDTETPDEFLSGFTANDRLIPVITITV